MEKVIAKLLAVFPELKFIKPKPIAIGFTKLICTLVQSPLKTIDLGPLTKKSNSLNL
jgi:hypothetical protein